MATDLIPAGADRGSGICSICQASLASGEPVRACDYCRASFHADCWAHNDGCGTYGCKRAPEALKLVVEAGPAAGAWGDVKTCPNCGEDIDSAALKCPRCKAEFDTRAPLTPADYRNQLLRHATARRDTLLASILMAVSALGAVAPATLALGAAWAFARRGRRRAAAVADLLILGSAAVSAAYAGLMVAIFGFGW